MEDLLPEILKAITKADSLPKLEEVRQSILGKKGSLAEAMRHIGGLPPEERRLRGEALNSLKVQIQDAWNHRKEALETAEWSARLSTEKIDVTCPPSIRSLGRSHPLMQVITEVVQIFSALGFSVRVGPDVEDVYHNFTALNVPEHHPARAMQDTFYFNPETILRTQTSPMQIRTLKREAPPLRIVVPGRVYRADAMDMTHTPMFHQLEGLVVGEAVHMGHLKGCLEAFLQRFFGRSLAIRFRPSFFPFTEPSAEVDIPCQWKEGKLEVGRGDEWLEVLGCGMVHPKVLGECGLDANHVRGFAFGMGIERLAMLKYGVTDIRNFYLNDQRWLNHFGETIGTALHGTFRTQA